MKSLRASPSFRNSGFEATANSCFVRLLMIASILSPVPTGTVDLVTTTAQPVSASPTCSAALKMYDRSAEPSGPGGVPTASRITSAPATPAFTSVVKRQAPFGGVVGDQLVEARLVDRHLAALEAFDLLRVEIAAGDVVPHVREPRARRRARRTRFR